MNLFYQGVQNVLNSEEKYKVKKKSKKYKLYYRPKNLKKGYKLSM